MVFGRYGIGQPIEEIWGNVLQQKTNTRTINISMDGASNTWITRKAKYILKEISPATIVIQWSYVHRRESDNASLSDYKRRKHHSKDILTDASDSKDFIKYNMAYKILIMGLSGAGKTTLAKPLIRELEKTASAEWLNADIIRKKNNDWDFTPAGRLRQAQRIHDMASKSTCDFVICDFIAPTVKSRNIYSPDYTIWMDTIKSCKYTNTNELFTPPTEWNYRIVDYSDAAHINNIISDIQQRK